MLRKGDLAKLTKEGPAGVVLLVEALVWLSLISVAIRILTLEGIARRLGLSESGTPIVLAGSQDLLAQDVKRALRAVEGRLPWTCTCLCQALAGTALLTRRGLPAVLSLGVAKGGGEAKDRIQAHAWLDCGALNITGGETSDSFSLLAKFMTGSSP